MILDIAFFITRKAFLALLRERWRREFYGWGGEGYTGRTS